SPRPDVPARSEAPRAEMPRGSGRGAVASVASVASVAAAEIPAQEPAVGSAEMSVPARSLESFEDLVALAAEKRDLALKSALERDVRLVRFEDGRLEIGLESSAPKALTGELSKKLSDWTGRRWMVIVSAEPGLPSLYAQAQLRKAELKDGVRGDPLVQAVLARFPGAEIVDVRQPASAPAALDELPFDAPGEAGRADDEA
ncbi:MAG TPA: DNA polymerase III subunit gamma/tau, partial [Xanthobacteraceae bacterium]|nr:DNA polymerase III subunit gamma/tau [Xanthobacteraceae bacterium]